MPDDEFLARIDGHLERIDAHLKRGNEEMRLTREVVADTRQFTQQMIMRLDRMVRDNSKIMDRMGARIDRGTEELVRQGVELSRIAAEQRAENRAGREALFAMIDRLNGLDPPGAPG
jgi:uncharacterized coiled-coil protein SlyX